MNLDPSRILDLDVIQVAATSTTGPFAGTYAFNFMPIWERKKITKMHKNIDKINPWHYYLSCGAVQKNLGTSTSDTARNRSESQNRLDAKNNSKI